MDWRKSLNAASAKRALGSGGRRLFLVRRKKIGDTLRQNMPEDLLRYGLIPEFIGRVPVVCALDALDLDALIQILTEPKNALVKQFQKLLHMDGVAWSSSLKR